ncbi:retrograde regulation protein 2, partial [Aureobasidium melanogenum]
MTLTTSNPEHLYGLVDMGSNGIRFSITDLSPPTTRILPTLYTSRAGISLYDAQYSSNGTRVPISDEVIKTVVDKLTHFKRACADFCVPEQNITVLATEATRTAVNSQEFRDRIKKATGWEVKMLAKEDEGRVGALGVATSLGEVKGLVMDLGGGSTQLTWLVSDAETGEIKMPEKGAVSMPFGAAALSRRIAEAEKQGEKARKQFAEEVKQTITDAYNSLSIPIELQE